MEETVNEPILFEESDFAADQTENENSPAVEEAKEQPTSQDEATDSKDDSTEEKDGNANEASGDEIEEFLAKKGIKLDDPDALRKVADMYRNVEKDYGKKSQEKAQLERQLEKLNNESLAKPIDRNDLAARLDALEKQRAYDRQLAATREWKAAKNLSPETEQKMLDFLGQQIVSNGVAQTDNTGAPLTKMYLVQNGVLSLDDVYRAVGGDSLKADAIKQELKTAVANEIAAKQNAKSTAPLATNSTQFAQPKEADDEFVAGLFGD